MLLFSFSFHFIHDNTFDICTANAKNFLNNVNQIAHRNTKKDYRPFFLFKKKGLAYLIFQRLNELSTTSYVMTTCKCTFGEIFEEYN